MAGCASSYRQFNVIWMCKFRAVLFTQGGIRQLVFHLVEELCKPVFDSPFTYGICTTFKCRLSYGVELRMNVNSRRVTTVAL